MKEIEQVKLMFGIYLGLFGGVLVFLAFALFYKYLVMGRRCSRCAEGTVFGYTAASHGEGVYLPKVKYEVEGREYGVVGPRYRGVITHVVRGPLVGNTHRCYEKDNVLYVERTANSFVGVAQNLLAELYPVGSTLPVWYDPKKPGLSYALRPPQNQSHFWLTFLAGLSIWILDALMLAFL